MGARDKYVDASSELQAPESSPQEAEDGDFEVDDSAEDAQGPIDSGSFHHEDAEPGRRLSRDELYERLANFLSWSTTDGLFPVVAFGLSMDDPGWVGVLTCAIGDLPRSLEIVQKVMKKEVSPYRYIPRVSLQYIANKNAIMKLSYRYVDGFDSGEPRHRQLLSRIVAYCTAARFPNRAFMLVDIVGFSRLQPPEQLTYRMSLGRSISQCIQRMRRFGIDNRLNPQALRFNRSSTGDGFYVWSFSPDSDGHVATFLLMLFLMAHTREMYEARASSLQLRAGFAIGEAFTFPVSGPGVSPSFEFEGFTPDALGPVLNDLNRILASTAPGQIVVSPFDLDGREGRVGERLDIKTMLIRIASEIMPAELAPSDNVKNHDILLEMKPDVPYRVVDKHREVHYCYNIVGRIPDRTKDGTARLQQIGLKPDNSPDLASSAFRE